MLDPLVFGAYVAVFVGSLYAAAHFVAIRLAALPVRDSREMQKTRQSSHGQNAN